MLATVLVVAVAGCGTKVPSEGELAEALARSGLSEAVADCAAEAIVSTLSDDELATLVDRGSGGLPKDDPTRTDDAADTLRTAVSDCRTAGIDQGAAGGADVEPEGSGPSDDVTTSTGVGSSTTGG